MTPGARAIPVPKADPDLGLCPLFVSVPSEHAVTLKVLLESYEGLGVARTQRRDEASGRVLVALLLLPDTLADALAAIEDVREALDLRALEPTEDLLAELRRALLETPGDS